MPIQGAKVGDRAMTPAGRTGTVARVFHRAPARGGLEYVEVAYDEQFRGTQTFRTSAIKILPMTKEES